MENQIKSSYFVFSQILSLSEIPLRVKNLRIQFENIFQSESTYKKYYQERVTIQNIKHKPYNKINEENPFIKSIGAIHFNPNSFCSFHSLKKKDSWELENLLKGEEISFEDSFYQFDDEEFDDSISPNFFGVDINLSDQRLNYLYYELLSAPRLTFILNNQIIAKGKLFLHLYPSGQINILMALSLVKKNYLNMGQLKSDFELIAPWTANDLDVIFRGKRTNKVEFLKSIRLNIKESLYKAESKIRQSQWLFAGKILSDGTEENLKDIFPGIKYSMILTESRYSKDPKCGSLNFLKNGFLFSVKQNSYYRKNTQRRFWNILRIVNYGLYKREILASYNKYIQNEIIRIKENKLFARIDFALFQNDDNHLIQILNHLKILDSFVAAEPNSFYQKIYSQFSKINKLDKIRNKTKLHLKEWEIEIDKYKLLLKANNDSIEDQINIIKENTDAIRKIQNTILQGIGRQEDLLAKFNMNQLSAISKLIEEIESLDEKILQVDWNNHLFQENIYDLFDELKSKNIINSKREDIKKEIQRADISVKHKLKFVIPMLFLKYESEIELSDKQKIPNSWKDLKKLLIK